MDCIFCKIIKGEIPSEKLYEDEDCIVIRDIDPKAPKHFLFIPKEHYKYLEDITEGQAEVLGKMSLKLNQLVKLLGLEGGYRLTVNQGDNAGQTVPHLHIHMLSGKKMGWNPA